METDVSGARLPKPVHLYVKKHRRTGLKYFGRTTQDPYEYSGSGAYWRSHIQKYGDDVKTKVIGTYYDEISLRAAAIEFSTTRDIANNPKWANLLPEDGSESGAGWTAHEDHSAQIADIERRVQKHFQKVESSSQASRPQSGRDGSDVDAFSTRSTRAGFLKDFFQFVAAGCGLVAGFGWAAIVFSILLGELPDFVENAFLWTGAAVAAWMISEAIPESDA